MTGDDLFAARLSRRRFLAGAGAASVAGVATALAGCGNTPSPSPTPSPSASPSPSPAPPAGFFDAIAELREAVRGSPDHLIGAADRAVAAKDAEAIFRLVHDSVATYPAGFRNTGDLVEGIRWGTRATLHGGAGTPREKADLLAALYVRAGLEAEVVRVEVDVDDTNRLFAPRPRPSVDPAIDDDRLALVRKTLGLTNAVTVPVPLDPDGTNSKALADDLLGRLPERPAAQEPFSPRAASSLPMVRVVRGSETLLADPTGDLGLAPIGDRRATKAAAADGLLDVEVLVEAARSDAPNKPFTLVQGQWTAADLAGRRVFVGFPPPVESLEEFAAIRPRDVGVVVPVLTVRGPDLDPVATGALSFRGTAVTLGGQLIDVDGTDGKTRIDGEEIGAAGTDLAVVARVRTVEITAGAAGFPTIGVALRAFDADGRIVEGLGAGAFQVVEEGTPVGHTLSRSTVPPPRILVLLDDSDSIPDDFRKSGAAVVVRQIGERLLAADPESLFRVAMVDDEEATEAGDWTSNLDELAKQATRRSGFGSQLWEALADAGKLGATAIVFITDGAATDGNDPITEPPREVAARVRIGPPTIVIGVGEVNAAGLEALGEAGGLGSFPVAAQAAAVEAVLDALAKAPEPPYRLRYLAPADGPATRSVEVRLVGTAIDGRTTYDVPAEEDRATPPALSGLYLTVKVGRWAARRVLAGIETDDDKHVISPQEAERVRRALFGTHVLGFEAAAPSISVVLDDVFSSILALRPLMEATTRAERLAALAASPNVETPLLHAVTVALPQAGEFLTYEAGLRATLYRDVEVPLGNGRARRIRGVDILPLTGFMTTDPESASGFALTAERTARLSLVEAESFPISTPSALAGEQLVSIGNSLATALEGTDPAARAAMVAAFEPWRRMRPHGLVPADATPTAAWLFDPANGSLFGVLADASGGGSEVEEIEDTFDRAERLLGGVSLAGDVASLLGLGGFSFAFGIWGQLEATKLKKLKAATIMLATLQAPQDDIADLSGLGCSVAQAAAFEAARLLGGRLAGEAAERAVTLVGIADGATSMTTGSGFFC
jgi:hypothetical protein